jgi:hypothetical protein
MVGRFLSLMSCFAAARKALDGVALERSTIVRGSSGAQAEDRGRDAIKACIVGKSGRS